MVPITFQCHIGSASTLPIPASFSTPPQFLDDHFSHHSNGAIRIAPVMHLAGGPLIDPDRHTIDALDLHDCVAHMTRNAPRAGRVTHIGLVLAGRYAGDHGVLGVMFDRGFATRDDPNDDAMFTSVPREGCAVFLQEIAAVRDEVDIAREIEFTTIHELGHVFNLGHSNDACFMRQSGSTAYGNNHFRFNATQQDWLGECPVNSEVHPGGSIFQGHHGFNRMRLAGHPHLVLSIAINVHEFACISPVELDVTVSLRTDSDARIAYVPDRLDAGYDAFRIWVTNPAGERKLFRSPRHYCSAPKRRAVTRATPLARDITLSSGAHGRTFPAPGRYAIQAEFDVGDRVTMVSNIVEVEAVSNAKILSQPRHQLLASTSVRSLLYHRKIRAAQRTVLAKLGRHLLHEPGGHASAQLRYALVRALTRLQQRTPLQQRMLMVHLDALASDDSGLGGRQRQHLAGTMEQSAS